MIPYIDWDYQGRDASVQDVLDDFKGRFIYEKDPDISARDIDLFVAWYKYEDYSGSALVVYRDRRDGKVYEVNGGHCSCYGLEGQWTPEEVVAREILNRPSIVAMDDEVWEAIHEGMEGNHFKTFTDEEARPFIDDLIRMADDGCPHG